MLLTQAGPRPPLQHAVMRPSHLHLADGEASLDLDWDRYLASSRRSTARGATGWSFTFTNPARQYLPRAGVSVRLHGALRSTGRSLLRTVPLGRRVLMLSATAGRYRIPLSVRRYERGEYVDATAVVGHLAWVLRDRPELRTRLADRAVTHVLAADLRRAGTLAGLQPPTPVSVDQMNVRIAMRACGFHHRFGRPLTTDEVRPLDEVVDPVMERLAAAWDPRVRRLGRSWVEEVARVAYVDVEPWPFSALVQ